MTNRKERCETCRWLYSDNDGSGLDYCQRNAPPAYVEFDYDEPDRSARWPVVALTDFCGEWKAAEKD